MHVSLMHYGILSVTMTRKNKSEILPLGRLRLGQNQILSERKAKSHIEYDEQLKFSLPLLLLPIKISNKFNLNGILQMSQELWPVHILHDFAQSLNYYRPKCTFIKCYSVAMQVESECTWKPMPSILVYKSDIHNHLKTKLYYYRVEPTIEWIEKNETNTICGKALHEKNCLKMLISF